jgi:hypothetical protein
VIVSFLASLLLLGLSSCAPQLTAEQRRQDIEFLADWARDCSPTISMNELHAPDGIETLRSRYVELAEGADDNSEFVQIVYGYFHRIGQLGHGYVYPKDNLWLLMLESLVTGGKGMIRQPWDQFPRAMYWSELLEESFVHPPFRILQKESHYFTEDSWTDWFRTIPKGSQIVRVNGMTCPDYAQHLRENTWLRWIVGNTDGIEQQLLIVPDGQNFRGWDVEFLLPDGSNRGAFIPAKKGRMSGQKTEFLDWNKGNCICIELGDTVGYIRVKGMVHPLRTADENKIRDFLKRSKGHYDKLIIDVRGNGGGSTFYVYDTLIRPFLRQSVAYRQISGIRRKYRAEMTAGDAEHLRGGVSIWAWETRIEETKPPKGFDPNEWIFYAIDRQVKPSNRYDFDGRLYILTDRGSGSATETYADAVQRIGLGTLVGQRTAGALGGYFMADSIRLPASGMIVRLEADLDFNSDATVQERIGTRPDVELEPCDLPETTTKVTLLKDPWIRKVLDEL